ncbi:MAG TPA: benzoate-CoA ligase family protein [Alphaproteobacteria bacterium]|jgi:benzoate-CoA ligase family protein|nr:benzoate-CoA ligase family protein [Alphaproteobacteria bacterium]
MRDHTLTVDGGQTPTVITYADNFNCSWGLVDRHLEEGRGDKIFSRSATGELTYAQLAENQNRCGNVLLGFGLEPGDRVLMVVMDCFEFFFLFCGAIKAGIVPVPLNTMWKAKDYQFTFEDSGCKAVVYSQAFAAEVEAALEAMGRVDMGLAIEGEGRSLSSLLAQASSDLEPAPGTAEGDAFWLYSSGSTGNPKGTVHRHRDMIASAQHYAHDTLGMTEDDICFSAPKLFFAYGLGCTFYFPAWNGGSSAFFSGPPTPADMFDCIERFRPTLFFAVPTLYAAMLHALKDEERDLSSIRACVSGGEPLPADVLRRWQQKFGVDILDSIGSTELAHIFIGNRPGAPKPGSTGLPVPGYEAKIVDAEGNELPHGEDGRLIVKGPSTAPRYWNNPEKTAATMKGEWLDTGDTFSRDAEGYYYFAGRSDDMLKVGGIWVSPFEIEDTLVDHPKVLEAAVVGRADDQGMIKPEAFVVLNEPGDAGDETAAELLAHCKQSLAKYKYPRWINFAEDLPKTATGKIRRFVLRG